MKYLFVGGPLDGQYREVQDVHRPYVALDPLQRNAGPQATLTQYAYCSHMLAGESADRIGGYVFSCKLTGLMMNDIEQAYEKAYKAGATPAQYRERLECAIETAARKAGVIDDGTRLTPSQLPALCDDLATHVLHAETQRDEAIRQLHELLPFVGYSCDADDLKKAARDFIARIDDERQHAQRARMFGLKRDLNKHFGKIGARLYSPGLAEKITADGRLALLMQLEALARADLPVPEPIGPTQVYALVDLSKVPATTLEALHNGEVDGVTLVTRQAIPAQGSNGN